MISFIVLTMASHVSEVAVKPEPTQITAASSSARSSPGPRNCKMALVSASAVAPQVAAFASPSSKLFSTSVTPSWVAQVTTPVWLPGQTANTLANALACAVQVEAAVLAPVSIPIPPVTMQANVPT